MLDSEDGKVQYRIHKILNNNVILTQNLLNNLEMVLVGKGIGFAGSVDEVVELTAKEVERSFLACDEKIGSRYFQIINELDSKVIGVSEEIIAMAEKELGNLNPHIHIALTDHISFSLERLEKGLQINNPFLEEVRVLYSQEYKSALRASALIKERLRIEIPDSEVGFIAIHLHAARQNKKISETVGYTLLLKKLVDLIKEEMDFEFDVTDLSYTRLIYHLRFSIQRIERKRTIENPLLNKIKQEFEDSYELAEKVGLYITDNLNLPVSEDELGYIALHLRRLRDSNAK